MVKASACYSRGQVQLSVFSLVGGDTEQVVHTRASTSSSSHTAVMPTCISGKVTVGLESHWICITVVYPSICSRPK